VSCRVDVAVRAHERLRLDLMAAGSRMLAAGGDDAAFRAAHTRLAAFCTGELVPHLQRDEEELARAGGCAEGRLLAAAMRAEARALVAAVEELAAARDACAAAGAARVVHALLAAHIHHAELLATVS
jgi:hypothetical protein